MVKQADSVIFASAKCLICVVSMPPPPTSERKGGRCQRAALQPRDRCHEFAGERTCFLVEEAVHRVVFKTWTRVELVAAFRKPFAQQSIPKCRHVRREALELENSMQPSFVLDPILIIPRRHRDHSLQGYIAVDQACSGRSQGGRDRRPGGGFAVWAVGCGCDGRMRGGGTPPTSERKVCPALHRAGYRRGANMRVLCCSSGRRPGGAVA
jgi:hypothetical protein